MRRPTPTEPEGSEDPSNLALCTELAGSYQRRGRDSNSRAACATNGFSRPPSGVLDLACSSGRDVVPKAHEPPATGSASHLPSHVRPPGGAAIAERAVLGAVIPPDRDASRDPATRD